MKDNVRQNKTCLGCYHLIHDAVVSFSVTYSLISFSTLPFCDSLLALPIILVPFAAPLPSMIGSILHKKVKLLQIRRYFRNV